MSMTLGPPTELFAAKAPAVHRRDGDPFHGFLLAGGKVLPATASCRRTGGMRAHADSPRPERPIPWPAASWLGNDDPLFAHSAQVVSLLMNGSVLPFRKIETPASALPALNWTESSFTSISLHVEALNSGEVVEDGLPYGVIFSTL